MKYNEGSGFCVWKMLKQIVLDGRDFEEKERADYWRKTYRIYFKQLEQEDDKHITKLAAK